MTELHINERGELKDALHLHPVFRGTGVFFSWLFHPLIMIVWMSWYLIYVNDLIFLGLDDYDRLKVFLRVLSTSVFLPLITVLLLKGLGFIDSIQLKTQRERIIPLVGCITFFFWSYYVSKKLQDPAEMQSTLLALFISSSASLVMNSYFKVSLHAIGAGAMLCLAVLLLFSGRIENAWPITAALFIAGVTCSSRMIASDHTNFEIAFGFIAGMAIQAVCWWIVH